MSDKTYAQSIAHDLFQMIKSAQEQGVKVDKGFRNQALSSPQMSLSYLFLGKSDLFKVPALPPQVKTQVRQSNALAVIESIDAQGKKQTVGIHLIWSSPLACSKIVSEEELLQGIQVQGLNSFTVQLRHFMKNMAASTAEDLATNQSK